MQNLIFEGAVTGKDWFDILYENLNVGFYILGGIFTVITMCIGVLLIRRRRKVKIVEAKPSNPKKSKKKKN